MTQDIIDEIYKYYFHLSRANMFEDVYEISHGEFSILKYIALHADCEQITVSNIAETFNISNPAVSRVIKSLLDRGWLMKEENPEDRRVAYLELTEEGLRVYEKQNQAIQNRMQTIFGKLSNDDLVTLCQISQKLLLSVNETLDEARSQKKCGDK